MTDILNIWTICGIGTIIWGILFILFPPKDSRHMFGIRTKSTLQNQESWAFGQRIFAYLFIFMGIVLFLTGATKIESKLENFTGPLALLVFWRIIRFIGDKIVERKFQ
jgi:uncharacterized membrane protein